MITRSENVAGAHCVAFRINALVDQKIVGIPKDSVDTYRSLMQYGLKHDVAMDKLKELYEMNKAEHEKILQLTRG